MTTDYDDLCARLRDPAASRVYGMAGGRTCIEAADALDALREQVAACTQGSDLGYTRLENVGLRKDSVVQLNIINGLTTRAERAEADNAALREQLQKAEAITIKALELKRDADRYQWLRNTATYQQAAAIVNNYPEGLDAAIDAAIAGKESVK